MSYLAIARKYRPATFDEIVGQQHVTRTLENAIARSRIHHAYLFTGARGVGKTTAARALARSLNCEQGPTATPCGECRSCQEIGQGTSPDLVEIDGASNNSVDDIRELRETVRYAPTGGGSKIYLVDEVHMLSNAAFNALLKTLEEPPPHIVFIFATTEPQKIPDTILSRVQRFDFKRIPIDKVVERLSQIAEREGATVSEASLRLIARAGEGSMRDAQSLLDKVITFAAEEDGQVPDELVAETLGLIDRRLLLDMLEGLVTGAPDKCLDAIHRVYAHGYELSQFTEDLLETLRNATFVRISPGVRTYVDVAENELQHLDALTKDIQPEVLSRTFNALLEVHDQVARASRPRIVLEMAVARLATTRPVHPVGPLLGRLEKLERKLRTAGKAAAVAPMGRPRSPRGRSRSGPPSSNKDDRPRPGPAPTQVSPSTAPPSSPHPSDPPGVESLAGPDASHAPPAESPQVPQTPTTDPAPSKAWKPRTRRRNRADPPSDLAGPLPDNATPEFRWKNFQSDLSRASQNARQIASGDPEFADNGTLIVWIEHVGRAARLRHAMSEPEVTAAVARCYGPDTKMVIEVAKHESDDVRLKRQAAEHPAVRRIITLLGASLDSVTLTQEGADT